MSERDGAQPRTEAGRRFVENWNLSLDQPVSIWDLREDILAIEKEAAAPAPPALDVERQFVEWWDNLEMFGSEVDPAYSLMSVTDREILEGFRDQFDARLAQNLNREADSGPQQDAPPTYTEVERLDRPGNRADLIPDYNGTEDGISRL